jgi:hypothetical protein
VNECNAIIAGASIGIEENGSLTAWITLDYGGSGQGFGGFALYLPESFAHHAWDAPPAGHFIYRILQVAGVEGWSDLVGKTVRVRAEHSGVQAIGHIVKDDWFDPRAEFARLREEVS